MDPVTMVVKAGQTTSVFSLLAKFAEYSQKPWIIAIVIGAVAAIIAELVLKIRYSRIIGIALCVTGFCFLAYGVVLDYAKFRVPAVKVPATTWVWMPLTGIFLLVAAWALRKRRARVVRDRTKRLANAVADRIEALYQVRGASHYVEQLTSDGESVQTLLRSLVRRRRKGNSIILFGLPGAGKTATLLRFAKDCQLLRSGRMRPLIAIYVDLAEYAAQISENPSIPRFIQTKFIKSDSSELDAEKAWAESGRYVDWIFLFDNADEADLRQGTNNWSQQLVETFLLRYSRFKSFYAVIATHTKPDKVTRPVIGLGRLTDDGCKELLTDEGVDTAVVDTLATNEGFFWYLRDPGAITLLAPVLAGRTRTENDNVHDALRDAVDYALQHSPEGEAANLSSLRATATAIIKYLMRTSHDSFPVAAGDISRGFADIAKSVASSPEQIAADLTILANHGIVKRIPGRNHAEYIEFSSVSAAYFYAHALLDSPNAVPVHEMLCNSNFTLASITLLQTAEREIVARFLQEAESLLDSAMAAINQDELAELRDRIQWAKRTNRAESTKRAEREWADRMARAFQTNKALMILVAGVQNRPELLSKELRAKATSFTSLVMPFCNPYTQAHLLRLRYALGTPEQAVPNMEPGLNSQESRVVLDTASRIVNAINETTELTDVYRERLVNLIMIVGFRSLTINRGRSNLPPTLRFADSMGLAVILIYVIFFGLGGLLQLSMYWRTPFLQICEVIIAVAVTCPLISARHISWWRMFVLRRDFQSATKIASWSLAFIGICWAFYEIVLDLGTFTLPLMPLLASYALMWPAFVLFYLVSDPSPTIASTIFPFPRSVNMLWRTYIVERSRIGRSDRKP